ncbi:histidinol dehydrogenase [Tautonia marina]|uniref:histidinol dehydrogenase n=1 Tax=Tautonia marina TaxID=2653855 RepID=UPI0012604E2E|nr:histidinol dehydrogenase [Tautonia marina]
MPRSTTPALNITRIDTSSDDAREAIASLRAQLSPRGDVVSPRGRELTIAVFGEPLNPQQVVDRICADVREHGLDAVLDYTAKLDRKPLDRSNFAVSAEEMAEAFRKADREYLRTVRRVRDNILAFQSGILLRDAVMTPSPGVELTLRYRPMRRVGVCVPGGAAAYPSSLLMTVVPAQAAGVEEIAVVVPPTEFGGYNTDLLAACHLLGVKEVYRIGGAQAVAALAYGVEGIPQVDKIVGPGNLFVALAKQKVYGEVDIDSIAGPSEVVLIADWTAEPSFVAADLISQAEHSPGASILITWEADLIDRVIEALEDQLSRLSRGDLARDSLEQFGSLILVRDEEEAIELTNLIAPEHLHVSTSDAHRLADRLINAGAIFLGHLTPVAVGDYAAGPSHVLPTGGTARWASGLASNDFLKRTSLIHVDRRGLERLAPDVRLLADKEGLTAHRYSVDVRLSHENDESS